MEAMVISFDIDRQWAIKASNVAGAEFVGKKYPSVGFAKTRKQTPIFFRLLTQEIRCALARIFTEAGMSSAKRMQTTVKTTINSSREKARRTSWMRSIRVNWTGWSVKLTRNLVCDGVICME